MSDMDASEIATTVAAAVFSSPSSRLATSQAPSPASSSSPPTSSSSLPPPGFVTSSVMSHANFPTLVAAHFPPPTATLPPVPSPSPSPSPSPAAAALPVLYEGKTQFESVPGDSFHFVVSSDKVETVVALESRKFKQKWECRLDDAAVKRCGPRGVEVPRHAVVAMLGATLEGSDSTHQLKLERDESGGVALTLVLRFAPLFTPTYTFSMTHIQLSKEDVLQAQVLDLQEELATLRLEMSELRALVTRSLQVGGATAATAATAPKTANSQQTSPQQTSFASATAESVGNPSARSNLNARAAEFVFGRPAPTTEHTPDSATPARSRSSSPPVSKMKALSTDSESSVSSVPTPYSFAYVQPQQQPTTPFHGRGVSVETESETETETETESETSTACLTRQLQKPLTRAADLELALLPPPALLYDTSLGSLPTLVVPDDPLTGAIEKPKSPPPSARPDQINLLASSAKSPRDNTAADNEAGATATAAAAEAATAPPPEPSSVAAEPRPLLPPETPTTSAVTPTGVAVTEPAPETADAAPVPVPVPVPPPVASAVSSKDFKAMAKRAHASAKLDRLAGGNKSVFDAQMSDIGALGIGMQLYFMLTKYISVAFLIMGIVSLPTITLNLYGNGVTESMVDPLKLAYASLGNQGVHPDIQSDKDACLPKGDIDCTWTNVTTPFTSDPMTVAWIITVNDVVYSAVFFLFYLLFRYRARQAIDEHMNENLTPAKYAVFVRGLPPDATEKEIHAHFNELYDLTKDEEYFPLWFGCCWSRRRRKVKNSLSRHAVNRSVVTNLEHLAGTTSVTKELYLGSWIAEVSIGHPTGGLLRTFLSMEALTRSIAETQELVRILEADKEAAKTFTGPKKKNPFKPSDEKLLAEASARLAKLHDKLAKKTSKIKALRAPKPVVEPGPADDSKKPKGLAAARQAAKDAKKAAAKTEHAFNWDACECAFVVFNNLESRRRCLQDYRRSTRWLARRWQPKPLRFRNGQFPLRVVPAPEPSNILWENLEVTDRGRFYRRSFTNVVTLLLLLFSCAIISGAQSAQQEVKKKLVAPGFCDWTLPLVFYGNDSFTALPDLEWHLVWDQNATCAPSADGKARYHIAYDNGVVNELHLNRTVPVPAGATPPLRCVDACISETSNRTCSTMPCFDQALKDANEKCEQYPETNILFCFCKDALTASIAQYGFFDGPRQLWETYVPCQTFITDYVTRNVLMYVAAAIVVIVNLLLKSILRGFSVVERHSSESAKASALAVKMFAAQFLNTAIIVLVVNAALNLRGLPLLEDLFKGKFNDFERDWYPSVGMGITTTMLINAVVPQLVLCLQIYVVAPLTPSS
ncbi:hypothetical protein P43SY_000419 [Pythium insidiosum]|uniref:CSC1/OSCA1-like cytosolic domain-containing protein n=1 Tax=Pythium insidiosum TaxID=114742 RepID=A0AAD5Q852_PYTIN|nr:hypothetical protein P43SY_000419 [Pythium insidiosum]